MQNRNANTNSCQRSTKPVGCCRAQRSPTKIISNILIQLTLVCSFFGAFSSNALSEEVPCFSTVGTGQDGYVCTQQEVKVTGMNVFEDGPNLRGNYPRW